jgi:hypothetical protein
MILAKHIVRSISIVLVCIASGCVSRPPTIAHVHLGHALTGVHVTPGRVGYLSVAEERAVSAVESSHAAATATTLDQIKPAVAAVAKATTSDEDFGLKLALVQASNHINFAAEAGDASANVRDESARFAKNIAGVVERCDLIALLAKDVAAAKGLAEAKALAQEIDKLALQNLNGVDLDKNGVIGPQPDEYGVKQLRLEISDMVARENPPYRTVDQYYLFNLVRLPNGKWVFDKFRRGGNIDGYK